MGPALFGFGVTISVEREHGLLRFKRVLPMPPAAYIIAKLAMAMLFAAIILATMEIGAVTLAHTPLTSSNLIILALLEVFGVLPFCAIGLFLGTLVKANAAPGPTNLVYLRMLYLSGLFFPLPPSFMRFAVVWPAFHLNHLAQCVVGLPTSGSNATHVLTLLAETLLFTFPALRRLQRVL